jgi:iron complex transport system substrate-binding protein
MGTTDNKKRATGCLLSFFLLISVALSVCGCGGGNVSPERKGIITMGPHITETVFALGQGSRVIAVGSFDDYPPEVADLPKVGGYINPDLEKIGMLNPELLIVAGRSRVITEFAQMRGIKILNVEMDSLATIDSGISEIGRALGAEQQADALRQKIKGELDAVRAAVAGKPRPKVLIITMREEHTLNTLYTVSGKSFVSELVDIAGGGNIYNDASTAYLEASKETVVLKAPEVVLEFHAGEKLDEEEIARFIADWRQLPSLPAVQQGRIYIVTAAHAMRPGPRIGEIARDIARLLHPDVSLAN